jgi:hypothetical protein
MLRSILAILAGFFTVPIVSFTCDYAFKELHPGYGPQAYIGGGVALIVLLYGTFSVWLGGYITGMISRRHYVLHGVILGCLGLLIAIPVNIKMWHEAPAWYHIIGLLLVVPVSAWGAHMAGKRHERKAALAA